MIPDTLPTSHDAVLPHYTYLHEHSEYGRMPGDYDRARHIAEFLLSRVRSGADVLDCSAGRGLLVRTLAERGLAVTATEADPYLVAHDLAPYDARCLRYDALDTLAPRQWDAVVSADVLEHLLTEAEVRAALRALAARSRRWLCVSVGVSRGSLWPVGGERTTRLHYVVRRGNWWSAEVARVARIVEEFGEAGSWFMFAEVERGV